MATGQLAEMQGYWDIPRGWEWRTIEEVTDSKNNRDNIVIGHMLATEKGKDGIARVGGNIPLILSGDLENTKEINVSRWTTEKALYDNRISPRFMPTADRLLMALSWKGTAGKVGIFNKGSGVHSHSIIAIIPRPEIVYLDYLFYCFREKTISTHATGEVTGEVKKTSVTEGRVKQVKIPVPPGRGEQRRIVERIETLLSDVQKGREHLTIMKKDAECILDRTVAEIFDDERRKQWPIGGFLQEYIHILAHQSISSSLQYSSYGSIEFDSVQEGTGQLVQIPSFQERAKPEGKTKYILEDDQDYLLFVKPSPEKRRIAVLSHKKAVCSTSILPLSIRTSYQKDILADFLMWELLALSLSNPTQDPFVFKVSIPSKDEQQHIIAYLEDIRNQVLRIQDNLKKSEEQFHKIEQGILRDALSGKLFM